MQARLQPQGRQHARPWHRVSLPTRVVVRAQAATEAAEKPQLRAVVEVTGGLHRTVPLNGDRPTVSAPATSGGSAPGGAGDSALPSTWADPLQLVRSFFLPRGWPHSVTPDYLEYQLWTIPAHITGWMSHSLATSSMFKAVGIGMGPAGTVGTTAAIKWITKDGLGAAGRLFVGGKLSSVFDEDPKRWRMNAEFVTTLGLALEIATQLSPSNFVLLAGAGTLAKALGKGMGRPCFRVIQTYFSATNNVGDVAAKEEVWEVTAQMLGLAGSVAILKALEASNQPEVLIIPIWAAVHAVHVVLRYRSLAALRFPYPNQRRAAALAMAHAHDAAVPDVAAVNQSENALLPPSAVSPHVIFGCSLEEALAEGGGLMGQQGLVSGSNGVGGGGGSISISSSSSNGGSDPSPSSSSSSSSPSPSSSSPSGGGSAQQHHLLQQLVGLYGGERYMLTWHGRTAHVLLWEGAGPRDYMRAMCQAACLQQSGATAAGPQQLAASLEQMRARWADFEQQAEAQGWDLGRTVVPLRGTWLQQLA